MGRKAFQPTEKIKYLITNGAMIGMTWDEITLSINHHLEEVKDDPDNENPTSVSKKTLQRYFQKEYDNARPVLKNKLVNRLMQNALSGHPASLFFVLKTQFGFRETSKHELTGKDGAPIEHNTSVEHNGQIDINDSEQLEELMSKMDEFLEKSF